MGKTLKKTLSFVLAFIMVFGLFGFATTGAMAASTQTYKVTVTVTDSVGSPIRNAYVTLSNGTDTYNGTTKNNGKVDINVPAGTYTVTAWKQTQSYNGYRAYNGSYDGTLSVSGNTSATIKCTSAAYTLADAAKAYEYKTSFDHVDIRVAGDLSFEVYLNGVLQSTVKKTVTISSPSVVVKRADGTTRYNLTTAQGATYEWRWTNLSVQKTDSVILTCDITIDGVKQTGKTFTFAGKDDFVNAIFLCDGKSGLDFSITGEMIEQSFYCTVDYSWTGAPSSATLPTDPQQYVPGVSNVTLNTNYKKGDTITVGSDVYTFSGWTSYTPDGGTNTALADGAASFPITAHTTVYGSWEKATPTYTYKVQYSYYTVTNGATLVNDGTGTAVEQAAVASDPGVSAVRDAAADTSVYNDSTYRKGTGTPDVSSTGTLEDGTLVYTVKYYRNLYTYDVVYQYWTITNGVTASTADGTYTAVNDSVVTIPPGATAVQTDAAATSDYNGTTYTKGSGTTDVSSTGTIVDGSLVYTVKYYSSNEEWTVSYSWTSGTSGKDLPAALVAPSNTGKYASQALAEAAMDTTYTDGSVYIVPGEGIWTFSGWTKGTVANYNVPFTGEWTYVESEVIENSASFTVKKVGEDGTTPLGGASFTLTNSDNENVAPTTNATETTPATEFTFSGLVEGTYTLTETAPDGYKAAGPWTVTVSKETDAEGNLIVTVTGPTGTDNTVNKAWSWLVSAFTGNSTQDLIADGVLTVKNEKNIVNKTADTQITVIKTGTDNARLPGAEFTLYSDKDCKTVVATYTSDADGKLVLDTASDAIKALIKEGETVSLYLKETKAPDGYSAVDTVWTVNITSNKSDAVLNQDKTAFEITTANTISITEAVDGTLTVENNPMGTLIVNYFIDDSTYDSAKHTGTSVSASLTLTGKDGSTYNTDKGTHTFDGYTQVRVVGSTTGAIKAGETVYVDYLYKKTITVTVTHEYYHTTNGTNSVKDGSQTTTFASYEGEVVDLSGKLATNYKNNNYTVKGYDPSQKVTIKADGNKLIITYSRNISDSTPKTGDSSTPMILLLAAVALSAGGFAVVYFRKPKKHED